MALRFVSKSRAILSHDPDMVRSGEVDLVDGSVLLAPLMELQPAVLLRELVYTANDWEACKEDRSGE